MDRWLNMRALIMEIMMQRQREYACAEMRRKGGGCRWVKGLRLLGDESDVF